MASVERCKTVGEFLAFAKTCDDADLHLVYDWAIAGSECFTDSLAFTKALVASGMDIDRVACWPGQIGAMGTMLLSAAKFRNTELVVWLLDNGANVNAIDERGFNILDHVIMGHGLVGSCNFVQARVLKVLRVVLPRLNIMNTHLMHQLHPIVVQCFIENEWPGYTENKQIAKIVKRCISLNV